MTDIAHVVARSLLLILNSLAFHQQAQWCIEKISIDMSNGCAGANVPRDGVSLTATGLALALMVITIYILRSTLHAIHAWMISCTGMPITGLLHHTESDTKFPAFAGCGMQQHLFSCMPAGKRFTVKLRAACHQKLLAVCISSALQNACCHAVSVPFAAAALPIDQCKN